jgi:hypothetical protein
VTPSDERPAIHAIADQPRGRARDSFDGDGVVAEQRDETVALGRGRGVAGEEEQDEERRTLHLMPFWRCEAGRFPETSEIEDDRRSGPHTGATVGRGG